MVMSQEKTLQGVATIRDLAGQLHTATLEILGLTIEVTAVNRANPKFTELTNIVRRYSSMALRYMLWSDRIVAMEWLDATNEGLGKIREECSEVFRDIDRLSTCISRLPLDPNIIKQYYEHDTNISNILFELYIVVARVYSSKDKT